MTRRLPHDRADFGESARKTILSFTDDKGVEKKWFPDNPRTATAEFWEFVGDRSSADNEVFTIEDEEMGEGIQLHFYADSIARITTVHEGKGGSDPQYRVEYSLVDGIGGYRNLVSAFVRGGCAALEQHGSWMSDAAELERAPAGATPGSPSGSPRTRRRKDLRKSGYRSPRTGRRSQLTRPHRSTERLGVPSLHLPVEEVMRQVVISFNNGGRRGPGTGKRARLGPSGQCHQVRGRCQCPVLH